jgi:hypothetical protein
MVSKPNNPRFIACCVLQSHGKEFVCLLCAANKTWWKEVVEQGVAKKWMRSPPLIEERLIACHRRHVKADHIIDP